MKKCPKCGREYQDTNTLCPADGTPLERAKDWLIGRTLADKYRVDELISEGGMGAVYRGAHVLMDKVVAIKVLHPALAADDKIVQRFHREARAASRISHPHALNVTDFGESEDGIVFLVMEYLRGETLKEIVRRDGPMALPRVVEIIRQVSGALEAAHAEGVVHRDLKSDNIMLIDVAGGDWAKVLDFGIAKIQETVGKDPELTAPNLIIGTPQYMSPEQCSQASEIDSRSDIYSLGVILFEMLVGHVPFTGDSPTAIMMKHLQDPPPSVLEERRDLPAEVGRIVARALAKRPEDRFQTAGVLSEALTLAAGTESAAPSTIKESVRDTNRIVVPTGSNEAPRDTANDEYDEETVVRPRTGVTTPIAAAVAERSGVRTAPDSFNPWRIMIPALAGLIVIFGVIYALTRNRTPQPAPNPTNAPLVADPNSRPVQAAQPVTGQSEQGINAALPANTQPAPASANTAVTQPVTTVNENKNAETTPSAENPNANADRLQKNKNVNDNDNAEEEATPTPTPRANRTPRELPSPKPTASVEAEPLPPLEPKKQPTPKPTDTPPAPNAVPSLPQMSATPSP